MKLSEMLFPECILLGVEGDTKEEVLKSLFQALHDNGKVKDTFYDAILTREKSYPTGLEVEPCCVAIPHVTPEHVQSSALGVAVLKKPVEFERMDGEGKVQVQVIFNIALSEGGKQIETLQEIIAVISNEEELTKILQASTPEEIIKIIKEGEN